MKYYKLVTQSTYDSEFVATYVPFVWTKVPQDILNIPGSLFTIYSGTPDYDASIVILAKPCRQHKNSLEYKISGEQNTTLYV